MAFAVSDKTPVVSANSGDNSLMAVLGVGCESDGHQWVYVKLSDAVSASVPRGLVQGQLEWVGALSYEAPFVFHNETNTLYLNAGVEDAVSLIQGSESVTVSISWSESLTSQFNFALEGSKSAINAAVSQCGSGNT